ncbi:MAG: hypothetical protein D5S03_12865 [Desulfonatronospira sp. MSAO_Bac3]|nr:MAG: hypothetical protein D5S03_12865 [Desulfonatronospira sp. MSAO_Bac3]
MILMDTGPLVAFFDRSDACHHNCLDILKEVKGPLISVWPVLTEAFFYSCLDIFAIKIRYNSTML